MLQQRAQDEKARADRATAHMRDAKAWRNEADYTSPINPGPYNDQ